MNKTLAVLTCYNTAEQTKFTLNKFPLKIDYDILVVNDGSTDRTQEYIISSGFKVITHIQNRGVGAAIKTGIKYALENHYYAIAILAGNNKDDPNEIERLFKPIIEEGFDYIQGSRFLKGGRWDNLPLFRYAMVKVHALLLTLLTGKKCTDALNGFRAYRLSVFNDPRINIWQDWLDRYEFETYLHFKVLKLGYRFKEVPVSKIYPKEKNVKYTHIRPIIDWWSIMRPLVFLIFRLKK